MKIRILMIPAILAVIWSAGHFRASADLEVSAGISIHSPAEFDAPLAPLGGWVDVRSYGHCWRPAGVAAGWRPYCHGHWEWTDCGWYWESDEPWAWACYHYGSWVDDPDYGWIWVPGTEWAPAWVTWRIGSDYIGWAPCGPSGFRVEPATFVFVDSRHFHDPVRPDTVVVNNTGIFNRTSEAGPARRETRNFDGRQEAVMVNDGPHVEDVEKATGKKFSATPVREADQRTVEAIPDRVKRQLTASPNQQPASNAEEKQSAPQPQVMPHPNQVTPRESNTPVPREQVIPHSNPETSLERHKPDESGSAQPPPSVHRNQDTAPVTPPSQKAIPSAPAAAPSDQERSTPRDMNPNAPQHTQTATPAQPVEKAPENSNGKGGDNGGGNGQGNGGGEKHGDKGKG